MSSPGANPPEEAGGEPPVRGATPEPPPTPGLRRLALLGTAVMMTQAVMSRGAAFFLQIALAWLLTEEDFGLFSIVITVTLFSEVLKDGGVRDVLIQANRERWGRLKTPGLWLSVLMGVISSGLILGFSPVAAAIFELPILPALLVYMAAESLINATTVVPAAKLQRDMRFVDLAAADLIHRTGSLVAAVVLAWLGFGVFSFVMARPFLAAARWGWLWWRARPGVSWRPTYQYWGEIIRASWYLVCITLSYRVYAYADYAILGFFVSEAELGLYYFAFMMAAQSVELISTNVGNVLFPAFSKIIDEPVRRRSMFLRVCRVALGVGVPLVLLQAVCADAGVRALFESRWYDAAAFIAVLSLGMSFRVSAGVSHVLIKADGRFGLLLVFMIGASVTAVSLVTATAASGGGALGVAAAMAVWSMLFGTVSMWLACRVVGIGAVPALRAFVRPVAVGVTACLPLWALDVWVLLPSGWSPWPRLLLLGCVGMGMIVALTRWLNPPAWEQCLAVARRRRGKDIADSDVLG
ncbi:MAG: oligosaccharide flippase family protein [Planctomycetota bacterium]